jgi:hypothetical protein
MDIIKGKSIGILADSYYFFLKLCMAYGMSMDMLNKITNNGENIDQTMETLSEKFIENKYDGIFLVLHPKNLQLLKLSLDKKLRYIHIQKKLTLDARNNPNHFTKEQQQGTNSKNRPPPPDLNAQAIYLKAELNNLKQVNIREDFNSIIKKYFQHITPRAVDLNKFHKSGNLYSYLETFSTRMILVIREGIPKARVSYITRNYIDNLEKMRDKIDRENFKIQLNNFSSLEFIYEELVSFDKVIPLADGSRDVYKDEGLIYNEADEKCLV